MTRERFIDGRMDQLDLAHLAEAAYARFSPTSIKWEDQSESLREEYRRKAEGLTRVALSDWYDKMSPNEFSGCHTAAQVAENLYGLMRPRLPLTPMGTTVLVWGAIGEQEQDWWIRLVERLQLAQKANYREALAEVRDEELSSQEEGRLVCSLCGKEELFCCHTCAMDSTSEAFRNGLAEGRATGTKEATSCEDGEELQIQADRAQKYGDHVIGHTALGMEMAGILSNWRQEPMPAIPADIVLLLMAAIKINRAAYGRGRMDSYADARVYIRLAADAASRIPQEEK